MIEFSNRTHQCVYQSTQLAVRSQAFILEKKKKLHSLLLLPLIFLDFLIGLWTSMRTHMRMKKQIKIVRIIFIVIFHKFFDEITKVLSNNIIHETYRNIVNLDPVGTVKKGINAGSLSSFIAPNIKRSLSKL